MVIRSLVLLLTGLTAVMASDAPAMKSNAAGLPLNEPAEISQWLIVNDTVMGGQSSASIRAGNDGLVFTGQLSLENNGGFASVRRVGAAISWERGAPVQITVLGDGRTYQFRLRTSQRRNDIAYAAGFSTTAGKTLTLHFSEDDFAAVWRGRQVSDAPPLQFSNVRQLGFMLADKQPGPFSLTVKQIRQPTSP